jgi:hypothetical protein
MEGLTRLVSESLARHGFDRPLDYRRLRWSRWFRCDSHHSLLSVPSKPGVFAIAEEIMNLGRSENHVETAASAVPRSEATGVSWAKSEAGSRTPEATSPRRMLAVTQFFEDDDMAFVLDRMMSRPNAMNARLASGRYFARFVVIEDQTQRRSICNALNQWIASATEKATGIGSHFASSLELTPATEYVPRADGRQQSIFGATADIYVATAASRSEASGSGTGFVFSASAPSTTASQLNSGAATNIHCPSPFPSGF